MKMSVIETLAIATACLMLIGLAYRSHKSHLNRKRQLRKKEVSAFREEVYRLVQSSFRMRLIQEREVDVVGYIYQKHTFEDMLNSDRPLTLEEWYTANEIEILKGLK